jgi:GT2 family glycosyltransferase
MKVYVVVLNWNGKEMLEPCLESLKKQTHPAEIVLVDNGSTDGSVEFLEASFPDIHLLKKSINHGFAGGVNIGIKYAMKHGAEAVALFNNDAVAEPRWLKNLVEAMKTDDRVGIVTGRLTQMDKIHLDSTGDFYTVWGMPFPRGRNQKAAGKYDIQEEVFGASGGASLYRVTMFEDIGTFDESFFAYYEDVDVSFRARLAGWKIIYTPKAVAYHHISATSSRLGSFSRYHSIKNFHLLYIKNMPGVLFWKYLPLFIVQDLRLAASSTLRGGLLAYLKGFSKFLLLLPGAIKKRRHIQSSRKISTGTVDNLLYKHRPPRIP